jgi:hypothetical protein
MEHPLAELHLARLDEVDLHESRSERSSEIEEDALESFQCPLAERVSFDATMTSRVPNKSRLIKHAPQRLRNEVLHEPLIADTEQTQSSVTSSLIPEQGSECLRERLADLQPDAERHSLQGRISFRVRAGQSLPLSLIEIRVGADSTEE